MADATRTPTAPDPNRARRRRNWLIAGGVFLVLVVAAGVGVWWFFIRDDAPAPVDIESAVEGVQGSTTSTGGTGTAAADVDGTWEVDPSRGSFDDFTGSFAGFRVDEELASIGANTVVGRTPDVSGTMEIAGTSVTSVELTVDMSTLETDDSRRDGRMQDALATDEFPTATFVLSEPVDFGSIPTEGSSVSVVAPGTLTIHGVGQDVEFPLDAQVVDGDIAVVGSLDISFADYDVEAPSSPIVVSVQDQGVVEVQLFFTKQG